MSKFIVVAFPDELGARQGLRVLKDLNSERSLVLHGAGIVTKDADGKLSMHVASDDGLGVAVPAALIGGLAGLGVGLLAAGIMAAGGAVFGASAALTNRGAGKKVMNDVSRHLHRASAALVADIDTDDKAGLESRMEEIGGSVRHHKLPPLLGATN